MEAAGIVHEHSIPYDHQQNGLVERLIRTLRTNAKAHLVACSQPGQEASKNYRTLASAIWRVMSPEQREHSGDNESDDELSAIEQTRVQNGRARPRRSRKGKRDLMNELGDYITHMCPKYVWEKPSDVRPWTNAWATTMMRLRDSTVIAYGEFELDNRQQFASAILQTIEDSTKRISISNELSRVFVERHPTDMDSLINWFQRVGQHRSEAKTSDLVKYCELREGMVSFEAQELANTLETSLRLTFEITESELAHTEWVYRTFKETEVWSQFLQYFDPFADRGKRMTMDNVSDFFSDPNRRIVAEKLKKQHEEAKKPKKDKRERNHKQPRREKDPESDSHGPPRGRPNGYGVCFACGKKGHKKGDKECPETPTANVVHEQDTENYEQCVLNLEKTESRDEVILDSGASVHVFNHKKWFVDLKPCEHSITTIAGKTRALGRGTVRLPLYAEGGETVTWELKDCLYIPDRYNLVSKVKLLEGKIVAETCWSNTIYGDSIFGYRSSANTEYINLMMKRGTNGCDILPVVGHHVGRDPIVSILETTNSHEMTLEDRLGPRKEYFVGMVSATRLHTEEDAMAHQMQPLAASDRGHYC